MTTKISGSEALAYGALEAGVQFVTGYPGSPSTATVESLLRLKRRPEYDRVRVEWAINEKSAFDAAFGASLAGQRSLVCFKSVGLNVALDSLMVANLAGARGGFVVLVGDDPGGWGSQNEQDSRPLVAAAEVPLLEPTTVADARPAMAQAFRLSEQFQVPVVIRITSAMAAAEADLLPAPGAMPAARPASFQRQPERYSVLPIQVVDLHRRLQAILGQVQSTFEDSTLNRMAGAGGSGTGAPGMQPQTRPTDPLDTVGRRGIVAAGFMQHKLAAVLAQGDGPSPDVLALGTLHPLPERRLDAFLRCLDEVLVVEEIAPFVEARVQALVQRAGLALPVRGRMSGHLPGAGEILAPQIVEALAAFLPGWSRPAIEQAERTMPSRQPLCDGCPYIPALRALAAVMERHGGRESFVVTGETGCMVRAQLPPWEILDVKYGMGSSIGLAAGLARSGIPQRIVALSGDSAFLHSGLGELIDAAQAGIDLLLIVLANDTTALSGGQPHPATGHDAQGRVRPAVDLAALLRVAGARPVHVVDPANEEETRAAFEAGLEAGGLAAVVVRRACPRWAREP